MKIFEITNSPTSHTGFFVTTLTCALAAAINLGCTPASPSQVNAGPLSAASPAAPANTASARPVKSPTPVANDTSQIEEEVKALATFQKTLELMEQKNPSVKFINPSDSKDFGDLNRDGVDDMVIMWRAGAEGSNKNISLTTVCLNRNGKFQKVADQWQLEGYTATIKDGFVNMEVRAWTKDDSRYETITNKMKVENGKLVLIESKRGPQ